MTEAEHVCADRADAARTAAGHGAAMLALLACLLLLAGCGFQPLYARPDAPSSVSADLSRVEVKTIQDRLGQKVRNHLLASLDPDGRAASPLYALDVSLNTSKQELGLRITEEATRAKLTLRANFVLSDLRTGDPLYTGSARSVNSYNISASNYATLAAEQDALDRAARVVSDEIRLRLGLYFDRQAG